MIIIFYVLIGLVSNWLLGFVTKWFVDSSGKSIELIPPSPDLSGQWKELTGGNEGGTYLGYLERLLFFGAFWKGEPIVIGAWLAFKVASKWNAWTNIVSVPKSMQNR